MKVSSRSKGELRRELAAVRAQLKQFHKTICGILVEADGKLSIHTSSLNCLSGDEIFYVTHDEENNTVVLTLKWPSDKEPAVEPAAGKEPSQEPSAADVQAASSQAQEELPHETVDQRDPNKSD